MSYLTKINKTYYLRWYDGKKVCPACNGKKIVKGKACRRCRGSGEIYQSHEKALSPDRQTAFEYKAEFDRKFFRKELGLRDTQKTWASFVEEYLTYSKTNKAPGTYGLDRTALAHFTDIVKPALIRDITPQQLEKFKQERLKPIKQSHNKINSPTTVNIDFRSIKSALSKAVQWGYLEKNPAKYVKTIKVPTEKPRFLSNAEINKLLASADMLTQKIIKTLVCTGLRISELINLRWIDVDMKRKEIIIQPHDNFRPKSSQFRRIDIPDKFFSVLCSSKNKTGYVFTDDNSEKLKIRSLEQKFRRLIKKSGVEQCTPHDLRHTYASHLAEKGVDLLAIKELLGHSNITTTMIYAHLTKRHLKDAVNKLDFDFL